jgi:two-component system response regulator HydG
VDDEEHIVDLVDTIVRDRGFKSTCCTEGNSALSLLQENDYDLLICDYHMPGLGGRELMEWLQASGKKTKVLILSGDVIRHDTRDLVEQLNAHFLSKPFGVDDLWIAIERALGI